MEQIPGAPVALLDSPGALVVVVGVFLTHVIVTFGAMETRECHHSGRFWGVEYQLVATWHGKRVEANRAKDTLVNVAIRHKA